MIVLFAMLMTGTIYDARRFNFFFEIHLHDKIFVKENQRGQSRMENPKKLAALGTHDTERSQQKTKKPKTQHMKLK